MQWPYTLFALALFIGTLISIFFAWLAWSRRREIGANMLLYFMGAMTVWSFSYGMELTFFSLEGKRFWHHMAYMGIPIVAPTWLGLNLLIKNPGGRWTKSLLPLLFVEPIIVITLSWTDAYHEILWHRLYLTTWLDHPHLAIDRATGFWIHTIYAYALIIVGMVLYVRHLWRSPYLNFRQVAILFIGVIAPLAVNIATVSGVSLVGPLDLTPLALTTTGATAGWFIFRFRTLDILPLVWQTIFYSMDDGILVVDLQNRVIHANPRAQALLSATVDNLGNQKVTELLPGSEQAIASRLQHREADTIYPYPVEITLPGRPDLYLELTAANLCDSRNNLIGYLLVLRDITRRRQAEEALQHASRMEGIGLLAGGIAHDFNNILTGIIGQNALALRFLSEDNPAHSHIKKSILSAERAADLTRQLLAYAGKGKFEIELLAINRVIEENSVLLETAIPKKVQLSLDLAPQLPLVKADRGQLQSIIMNLVLNAADAIEREAGEIRVSTRLITLSERNTSGFMWREDLRPGEYVLMEVQDTGVGMDSETLKRIFDPFFTTKPTGRGLGLSTLLGTIRSHGGSLKLESNLGAGSTFQIVFPASALPGEQILTQFANGRVNPQVEGTVLIVDDEAPVREALTDILQTSGLQVLSAPDGRQGLDCFQSHQDQINLVVLDITMPMMDGQEVLKQLRHMAPKLPVILMSGYTSSPLSPGTTDNRYTSFVPKPCPPPRLIAEVIKMIHLS